ncbi:helix-turn-helix transcriptional regulator [Rhizobium sp. AQ_MP]|uniref:helix-turn-helix domain-containing protein n=1 Tax=Rhizobium sp. AQ_MP TaxID=2761536 RepID=UPI00163ABE80|nr:helix-turn-helix transcriptional regulator [Rhizobium sp. AQ_MP]MBC2775224.1 helix-turn-helix transcriptional regulator [Rhizobium sp. AQ_MP]
MTTGRQIAAARALLGMTEAELAEATGLSLMELRRIEVRYDEADNDDGAVASVKSALEDAGISFIDPRASSAAGGEGIRLSAPSSASVDTNDDETVQYPEMAQNGPFGAGG